MDFWTIGYFSNLIENNYSSNVVMEGIDVDFYKIICGYNEKESYKSLVHKKFCEDNNLRYFGELVERADERHLVDDMVKFRTLLLFVCDSIQKERLDRNGESKLDYNTNQLDMYYERVEKRLESEFDLLSTMIILNYGASRKYIKNYEYLLSSTIEYLKSNNLDSNTSLLAIAECLNHIQSDIYHSTYHNEVEKLEKIKNIKREFIELLSSFDIELIKDRTQYFIYIKVAMMVASVSEFESSKNFSNKKNYKIMRAIYNFATSKMDISKNKNAYDILEIGEYEGIILNFLLINSFNSSMYNNRIKVGSRALKKINMDCISLYCHEEKMDEFSIMCSNSAFKIQLDEHIDKSESSYYYSHEGDFFELIAQSCFSNVHVNNMKLFIGQYNNNLCKAYSDTLKVFKYIIIEDRYKEFRCELNENVRCNLIKLILQECECKEDFDKYLDIAKECGVYSKCISSSQDIILKSINFKSIDIKNVKHCIDHMYYKDILRAISSNLSNDNKVEYVKDLLRSEEIKNTSAVTVKDCIDIFLDDIKEDEVSNDLLRDYYELMDYKSKIIRTDTRNYIENVVDYYRYVINNLKNDKYLKTMEINEDSRIEIAKKIYKYVEVISGTHFSYGLTILKAELKELFLSDKELKDKINKQRKQEIEAKLKVCKETKYLSSLLYNIQSEEDKSVLVKMKNIFLEKLPTLIKYDESSDKIINLSEYLTYIKTIAHFNNHECFSKKELNEITEKYILNVEVSQG